MIPQFILDNCATKLDDDTYYFSTKGRDGYVVYWVGSNDTFHTYRNPEDWYQRESE